jgi:P-type Mg2+ transporter
LRPTAKRIRRAAPIGGHLERQLGAGRNGLSSAEAVARRLRYGPNTLEERRRLSLPLKFLSRFRNPLVIILLAAAVISALTGDLSSLVIISTIVLMSAVLDTVQEFRAEEAAESLKVSVALKEQVLRDGQEITVPGQDLVPGDVVLLAAGDLVPADGRLLEARDFFVNEALLTGESFPAEKHARDEGVDNPDVAEATNAAFMGSSVMNGSAKLLVCGTGLTTQLGQISSTLRRAPPPSALDQGTHRFGMLIVRFTEILVLFVLLINLLFHRPWLESFLFAVALAVGLTPELLPMIVSVTLARGALRMARAHVIVKRLGAIHDLGSMDVLCTDKTGTLTEAKISLARQVALSGADSERVLDLASLNSHFQAGLRNPLDTAILRSRPTARCELDQDRRSAVRFSAARSGQCRLWRASSSFVHRGRCSLVSSRRIGPIRCRVAGGATTNPRPGVWQLIRSSPAS